MYTIVYTSSYKQEATYVFTRVYLYNIDNILNDAFIVFLSKYQVVSLIASIYESLMCVYFII